MANCLRSFVLDVLREWGPSKAADLYAVVVLSVDADRFDLGDFDVYEDDGRTTESFVGRELKRLCEIGIIQKSTDREVERGDNIFWTAHPFRHTLQPNPIPVTTPTPIFLYVDSGYLMATYDLKHLIDDLPTIRLCVYGQVPRLDQCRVPMECRRIVPEGELISTSIVSDIGRDVSLSDGDLFVLLMGCNSKFEFLKSTIVHQCRGMRVLMNSAEIRRAIRLAKNELLRDDLRHS